MNRSRRLRAHALRRRSAQRGVVMLVVMFVLMMGTVGASLAVDAATNGLRAAGHNRIALQTRYMAEAQLMAAVGFMEAKGPKFKEVMDAADIPDMNQYGYPDINLTYYEPNDGEHDATQIADNTICVGQDPASGGNEWPPIQAGTSLDFTVAAVAPPLGCAAEALDRTGTIGPGSGWVPRHYRIDIYDCVEAPQTSVAGEDQKSTFKRLACVMSTRGRMADVGTVSGTAPAPENNWSLGTVLFSQATLQSQYEATMTIITPEFTP